MKTRVIILILVTMLALGMTASAAASGPPWPAEVFNRHDDGGLCWVTWARWVDGELTLFDSLGTPTYVYAPRSGVWNARCDGFIDFDDPSVATIQEVCAAFSDVSSCSHSTFILRDTLWCFSDYNITTDTSYVVNPSGHAKVVCHFNPTHPTEP